MKKFALFFGPLEPESYVILEGMMYYRHTAASLPIFARFISKDGGIGNASIYAAEISEAVVNGYSPILIGLDPSDIPMELLEEGLVVTRPSYETNWRSQFDQIREFMQFNDGAMISAISE